jgi:SIR2-like domain
VPPPPADTISLPDTLALLDGQFAELAAGVANGAYAIWLGSGVSFKKMPRLADLAEIVIEHLRAHAALAGPCVYRDSLDRILALTPLDDTEKSAIDFSQPVSTWTQRELIRRSLVMNYARMLDLPPRDKSPDYLLWDAVKVVRRYANPAVTPGVEHLALAALVIEGVASEIASANWDGLLEAAVARLAGTLPDILQVRVLPADYRKGPGRARLYKFHGCAVLAGQDETTYRGRLVGRQSQLDAWAAQNPVVEARLISLAVNQPTLMLGLSAQDFNIRGVFVHAQAQMTWPFPSHPPAFLFS